MKQPQQGRVFLLGKHWPLLNNSGKDVRGLLVAKLVVLKVEQKISDCLRIVSIILRVYKTILVIGSIETEIFLA